jgi:hypothetical protein
VATKADLRRLVLVNLKVLDETENPSAEQASLLDLHIAAARGELFEKGLVWWDDEAIPDAVLIPYRAYIAGRCCTDFGRDGKGYEALGAAGRVALAGLKSSDQREEQRAEYF